jgi:acyl-CoA-binding protein
MTNSEQFQQAVVKSKQLPEKPSNDILLKLYSLYKQATEGDVSGERPGGFDFKAIAKYDAWAKRKGTPSDEAEKEYIELVNSLS